MLDKVKRIDGFTRNIIVVFAGTSLANLFNFLYQLFIAHRFSPSEFAAFNTLIAICMVVATPLATLQTAMAKYCAGFNARNETEQIRVLLSRFLKAASALAVITLLVFYISSSRILGLLKIPSVSAGYLLAGLLALAWIAPVLMGGVQGLERFGWLMGITILAGALKLGLAYLFVSKGRGTDGALEALLIASFITVLACALVLKNFIPLKTGKVEVPIKDIVLFLIPVALSSLCLTMLTSLDMVLVKIFFNPADAGYYSLAQMLGKIFLFLPASISIVMLPRTSGLHALRTDTMTTLKHSLFYAAALCGLAIMFYNLFPAFVLTVITGKAFPESILLGRLFSITMSFFTVLSILVTYFLSVEDMRFIKYLLTCTLLQFLGICFFHASLLQVQLIMCVNAILLLSILVTLAYVKPPERIACSI